MVSREVKKLVKGLSSPRVSLAPMASDSLSSQLYNKPAHRHILVGNWQEEQKLLETTGSHRYKVWRQGLEVPRCCTDIKVVRPPICL